MTWSSFAEFTDMGGYALYVWGSYLMTAAALAWEALMLVLRRRRAIESLHDAALTRQGPP
jgi:heme exporter protein D